ncbi:MAG: hypothetical protein INR69_07945 [Mucilaginibacter polytrichastri]|nr:hypothetical protein [Mucilaginibacter polytrichastri]
MEKRKNNPLFDTDDAADRDRKLKDDLDVTTGQQELSFNKEKNSFELDVKSDDPDYDHPDPYDTAAENGEDDNSDYDEANPYVGDEYDKDAGLEHDLDKLGMHVDGSGSSVRLSKRDEKLAETDEDQRDDLDEEGYPKNDRD